MVNLSFHFLVKRDEFLSIQLYIYLGELRHMGFHIISWILLLYYLLLGYMTAGKKQNSSQLPPYLKLDRFFVLLYIFLKWYWWGYYVLFVGDLNVRRNRKWHNSGISKGYLQNNWRMWVEFLKISGEETLKIHN